MRPSLVEVGDIAAERPRQLSFVQDEDVVEAFATHTAEESLTEPVGPWRPTRCPDDFYPVRLGNAGERSPILVVVVVQ